MRKVALVVLCALALACAAEAQFTVVTGTVVDSNGVPYAGGTIAPTLVASTTPTFIGTGLQYQPPTQPVGLNNSGVFTMSLADRVQINPSGTTWTFVVCSWTSTVQPGIGTGPVCFTVVAVAITGATQDLSSILQAAALPLTIPIGGGGGNISGPGSSCIGCIPIWNNTSGTQQADSGISFPLPNSAIANAATTVVNGVTVTLGSPATITAAPSGTAGGTDVNGTYPSSLTVVGFSSVPKCTGFAPTTLQFLQYTTGGSPNPCWTTATGTGFTNPMNGVGDSIGGGASGAATQIVGPTSPNGVAQAWVSVPSGGVATLEQWAKPGIAGNSQTGTTYTITSADCGPKRIAFTGTAAVTVTLPTATTLAIPLCSLKIANDTNSTVTVTPTTWTISLGSNVSGGSSSLILQPNQTAVLFVDPANATNWAADVIQSAGQSSIASASSGINTVETVVGQTPQAYPTNSIASGTVFRITAWGTCTTTVANTSTFKVRIGTAGTTSDTGVVSLTTGAAGTTGTNVPFRLVMDITVRTTGSGTSATVTANSLVFSSANGIQGATSIQVGSPSLSGFDSTTANFVSLTYQSAAATTTSTFNQVTIERLYR